MLNGQTHWTRLSNAGTASAVGMLNGRTHAAAPLNLSQRRYAAPDMLFSCSRCLHGDTAKCQ